MNSTLDKAKQVLTSALTKLEEVDKLLLDKEVLRIVRSNADKTGKAVMKILQKELPDVSIQELVESVNRLLEATK